MPTIAHLSDLHFGRENPRAVNALAQDIQALRPDAVVNSGDTTQRSRNSQWRKAKSFLDGLNLPTLTVCGNHDIPLFNLFLRFYSPYGKYHRWIGNADFPTLFTPQFSIVGVQTARPFVPNPFGFWKDGVISDEALDALGELFQSAAPAATRIVVLHHPLVAPVDLNKHHHHICWRAETAFDSLRELDVSLVLSGHLHWSYALSAGRILCIQSGTGVSSRRRGTANSYNLLKIDSPEKLTIERREFNGEIFAPAKSESWSRSSSLWNPV